MSAELPIAIIAAGLMIYAAYEDFTRWKIPNAVVLALVAAYAALALVRWMTPQEGDVLAELDGMRPSLYGDLAAGLLLFLIGFALWMIGMMGAGDAKLLFPVGLFVGWTLLLPFAVLLTVFGVLAYLLLKLPIPLRLQFVPGVLRLDEIRKTGKVPYGVVIVGAALVVMYGTYVGG
ncbi:A24 family peptidase [Chelativorans salis]|uniref:Prepilin peptidase n=1 Tax=Chelativorans salis TaxID=2978478 RepID=A0ABT2LJ78_9HYPH|nr:prepilin peptidase [Chelativorans sp. EGI FJ00035]MCT7374646.1 prepilin peptidase [Chelativorans sp. EGI FJ00035]